MPTTTNVVTFHFNSIFRQLFTILIVVCGVNLDTDASKSSSNSSRASLSPTATRRAAATVPLVAPAPVIFHFHSFILLFQSISKYIFFLFQQTPTLPTYIDMDEIDRFFTRSVHLTGNAILDFVSGVCDGK